LAWRSRIRRFTVSKLVVGCAGRGAEVGCSRLHPAWMQARPVHEEVIVGAAAGRSR
jgi:hypothetical protein